MKFWTRADVRRLDREYPHKATSELATALGMTVKQVYTKAHARGLKKDPAYLRSGKAMRYGYGQKRTHQFPKGGVPWNKGKKGVNGVSSTRFKKGHMPSTWKPIGSERYNRDGHLMRKVADTRVKNVDWRPVHVLMWEEHFGVIPNGMIVVFKDRNPENRTIANLECISRAENMRRNSHYTRYPAEISRLIQLRGALNRKVNERMKREH